MGRVIPPFLLAVAGKGPFRIEAPSNLNLWSAWPDRYKEHAWLCNYRLVAEGERFPLAAGSLGFLMKNYQRLATDYLRRRK